MTVVLSFNPRMALSASPFVYERWEGACVMIPLLFLTSLNKFSGLVCEFLLACVVFNVQNFVICNDQGSKLLRGCNLVHALLGDLSSTLRVGFFILHTSQLGSVKETTHIVVSSWFGTDDNLLSLGIFCQSITSPHL